MKQSLKSFAGKFLFYSGLLSLANKLYPTKDITVLMYHHVDPTTFEDQVKYIKEKYHPLSEKDLHDYYYKNKTISQNSVLLTFDDGYYNNYKYAYPILKKYGIPAVIFLVSGLIGKQTMPWYDRVDYLISNTSTKSVELFNKRYIMNTKGKNKLKKECYYFMINTTTKERELLITELEKQTKTKIPSVIPEQYRFMNWDEVKEIQDIFSIGSHTFNHPILPNESKEEQEFQIKKSHDDLKKQGITPLSFCYPNGDYNIYIVSIVKKYFKLAYSANFGKTNRQTNKFLINRVGANIQDNKYILAVKLSVLQKLFNKSKKSTKFKIIHLTNYYFPQIGGITTAIHTMKNHLESYNIPHKVICYPYFFRKIENLFETSRFLHKFLVLFFAFQVLIYVFFQRLLHRKIVVHSHSANFCAYINNLTRLFGTKTIHTFHTDPQMNNPYSKIQSRPFLNKLHKLTAVSYTLAQESKKIYRIKKDIEIIYNSTIQNKRFPKNKSKKFKVSLVANLLAIKDPLLFIKAIEHISATQNIQAQIIGDGPLRKELEVYIQKNQVPVSLRGSLSHEETVREIASSDVFALTSISEGLGIVILEAISQNTPVVATNVGGVPEIINHKKTGILVDSREPSDMAKGILQAHKLRNSLTKNASSLLEDRFDTFKNMNRYVNLYCYLLKEKVAKRSENER